MPLVYRNFLQTKLEEAITVASTHAKIPAADYTQWLSGLSAGDYFLAVLIDATNTREIVQVNFTGSTPALGVAIDRGKEGTTARGWAAGTFFWQDLTQTTLDLLQKAGFRSGAFNPNGTLTQDYFGEKFYQTDLQLWWKSVTASEWRLIVGEILTIDPVFSPVVGTYFNGTLITITSATPGANIYYTIDGSEPDETDTLYTVPFALPNDAVTTLKAKAFGANRWESPSGTTTGVYTMQDEGTMWTVAATELGDALTSMIVWNGEIWIAGSSGRTYKYNAGAGTIDLQNNFTGFAGVKRLFVGPTNLLHAIYDAANVQLLTYQGSGSDWFTGGFVTGAGTVSRNLPAFPFSQDLNYAYFTAQNNLYSWDYTLAGYTLKTLIAAATQGRGIAVVSGDGSGFDRIYVGDSAGNVRRLNIAQNGWDLVGGPGLWTNVANLAYDAINNRLWGTDDSGRPAYTPFPIVWNTFNQFSARSFGQAGIVRNGKFYFVAGVGASQLGDLLKADISNFPNVVQVAPDLGFAVTQLIEFGGTIFGLTNNRLLEWA